MTRRFQFSLRALLLVTAILCLPLGGWHLFKKYGQFIEASPIIAGQPIVVNGRLIQFFGPKRCHYCLDIWGNHGGGLVLLHTCYGFADRSGPFTYSIHAEYSIPQFQPGQYRLALVDGYHPQQPTVFGNLVARSR